LVLQRDVQAFLSHPVQRIHYVRLSDRFFATWTNDYVETSRNMAGLEVDWSKWTVRLPPNADDNQRDTVKHFLMRRPAPPDGHIARFRREWFGRILDRYRRSPTRIVFLRLPRGPVARPEELSPKGPGVIREFASRPNVVLLDEHAFDALNHPECFKDAMHLNREGVVRFTPLLVEQIGHAL